MKTTKNLLGLFRKKGIALILVVSVLSLLTVLMLAMFSATDNEFKSTQGYVAAQDAKRLGDMATNIVASQLRMASTPTPGSTARWITATQPGCVRQYNTDGTFNAAFMLYSCRKMQIHGTSSDTEKSIIDPTSSSNPFLPPADWDQHPDNYVDLNQPVIRPAINGTSIGQEIYFPIVDPTNYRQDTSTTQQNSSSAKSAINTEGFSYTAVPVGGSQSIHGVVLPTGTGSGAANQRLPMPVEWLYVLQDGSMGTVDPSTHQFTGMGGATPSASNPIVGRVAFWADDETCKINVNTASEPTFWATPRFYHEREHQWVDKPPTAKEYQRFPGHPATVALSSVFYPDVPGVNSFDLFNVPAASQAPIIARMNRIYDLAPKIARGGSVCGTKVYAPDDESGLAGTDVAAKGGVSVAVSVKERLYASLDEMFFSPNMTSGSGSFRQISDNWLPSDVSGAATPIIDTNFDPAGFKNGDGSTRTLRSVIEQSRFFLTANSRAPEFTNLGTPKLAMWPIPKNLSDPNYCTVYDKLIAFCTTLKSDGGNSANTYYFQREKAHDANNDIALSRNKLLLQYLKALVSSPMPLTGTSGTATTLNGKYTDDNMNTLLVEMFDYIRATNLYDDILALKNPTTPTTGLSETQTYTNAPAANGFYTYTNPLRYNVRTADSAGNTLKNQLTVGDDGWPGHGTVTPSIWSFGGNKYRGMGRFFTISEIGVQLICTADGKSDDGSYIEPISGIKSGGRTAQRIDPNATNNWKNEGQNNVYSYMPPNSSNTAYWYSNYPPKPSIRRYGTEFPVTSNTSRNPNKHPGYDPANWNLTLDPDSALDENSKRVQALIDFEFFCPAEGWTLTNPEWTMILDGNYINGITVAGQTVWQVGDDPQGDVIIKSNKNIFGIGTTTYRSGGSADPPSIYSGRRAGPMGNMPKDPGFDASAQSNVHAALDNCNLVSKPFTVPRDQNMIIKFPAGQGMVIKLYDTHDWQKATPVQLIHFNFATTATGSSVSVPTPELVTVSSEKRQYTSGGVIHTQRAVDAIRWWAFSYGGALGRYKRNANPITTANEAGWGYADSVQEGNLNDRYAGRFRTEGDSTVGAKAGIGDNLTTVTASNAIIYGLPTGLAGKNDPKTGTLNEKLYGTDVIRSMTAALGDYRIICSRYEVPTSVWQQHRLWSGDPNNPGAIVYQAHNFCGHDSGDAGFDFNLNPTNSLPYRAQFVKAYSQTATQMANFGSKMPDIPQDSGSGTSSLALEALNTFLDFDNGQGSTRDGAYCNKPDEGNFSTLNWVFSTAGEKLYRNGYFYANYEMETDKLGNGSYFTPNRLIASPVMFGSLVTSVFTPVQGADVKVGNATYTGPGRPWQTLLFRPHVVPTKASNSDTDGTAQAVTATTPDHPGSMNPPDHYLLDLFTMPVVEPYAISEPLSEAGKINLNYQIVPFTYIRRATAVYAAMKGELLRTVPLYDNGDPSTRAIRYKSGAGLNSGQVYPPLAYFTEQAATTGTTVSTNTNRYWHRTIDPLETTKQLDERFTCDSGITVDKRKGLLRSASQICELHMIPYNQPSVGAPSTAGTGGMYKIATPFSNVADRETKMKQFWAVNALTGDNTREEIYMHLYPKFTTRSNTFRVHVRAQALKKARSTSATTFDSTQGDKVLSEYRGSYLLERYIDPNDTTPGNVLPDYTNSPLSQPSLETFYRFHVLETKRFAP